MLEPPRRVSRVAKSLVLALACVSAGALAGEGDGGAPLDAGAPDGSTLPAFDQPSSAPSAEKTNANAGPRPTCDYVIRARLDPATHTIAGQASITLANRTPIALGGVWLHLYLNAFKNEKSVFLREPVGSARGTGPIDDWGSIDVDSLTQVDELGTRHALWSRHRFSTPGDETDAYVPLAEPVAAGGSVRLEVKWRAKLPSIVERTGYSGSYHFVAQWFPKLAKLEPDGHFEHFPFHHLGEFYSNFGAYDVTLDVPSSFQIGATGVRASTKESSGRRIERRRIDRVHDFAWVAWDAFLERHERIGGVDVTLLHPPGYESVAERDMESLRFALPHYASRYGPYPYPVLTLVHPPEWAAESGGMEYPTLFSSRSAWYVPHGIRIPELITLHEFGHQYFYGLVASNETRWPFLDEGLNSYAEAEALRAKFGPASVIDVGPIRIADDAIQGALSAAHGGDESIERPAHEFSSGAAYSTLVYMRTAALIETTGRVWGQDRLAKTMRAYVDRYRFGHPTPSEFLAVVREHLGPEAYVFLDEALRRRGWVDFVVTAIHSKPSRAARGIFDRAGHRETVASTTSSGEFEGYALVHRRGSLVVPVDVEIVYDDGRRERVHWDGHEAFKRFTFRGPSGLRGVVIDPDEKILIERTRTNNFGVGRTMRGGSTSVLGERLSAWAAFLMEALGP